MFGFCQKMDTPFEIIRYVLSPCGSESPFVRSYVDLQSTQLATHLRPGGAPGVTPIRWGGLPRHIDFCLDCRSSEHEQIKAGAYNRNSHYGAFTIAPMFSRLSVILLLVPPDLPVEAAILKGVILANELSGPPMENIEIDATSGTNHTVSDSSGRFILEFPHTEEARKDYTEALETYRELARENPKYLLGLATTLNNLRLLDRDENRPEEAEEELEEALQIRRELAQRNRWHLPSLAATLNNLGLLDSDQDRNEEARREYEEALQIRRELAEKNPEAYLPDVAETPNNLGLVESDQNRMEEAR
jgi:tetratricopeptide repeat protein